MATTQQSDSTAASAPAPDPAVLERAAFPDMQVVPDALAADGELVMYFWVATGTHRAPYRGAPPSGQQVTWTGMVRDRVVDGQLVERWAFPDPRTPGSPHEIATR
jgi:predicted ester cyclase